MDPDCFNGSPRIAERRLVNLAIVGAEAQTRENAPYDNLDYDIWSFADWLTADWLRRCDAILEVHPITAITPERLATGRHCKKPTRLFICVR